MSPPSDDLAPRALAFVSQRQTRYRRDSDGQPSLPHRLEVARLLRDAGCSEIVVAAGLLHDVVEDTDLSLAELSERFGDSVAELLHGVSDDSCVESYRERKQVLRDQVRFVGGDVALLFAADEISEVREWLRRVERERARLRELPPDSRARRYVEHHHELRIEHYRASLAMLERVAAGHPLVTQLAQELELFPPAPEPPPTQML